MVWLHHLSSLGQTLAISSVYDKTIKSWWKSKDGQFKTNLQINDQLKYEVCAICTFLSHSIQATENKTVNPSCFLFHSFNNLSLKCSIIWPIISLPNVFGKNHPYNTFMHILKILGKFIINKQVFVVFLGCLLSANYSISAQKTSQKHNKDWVTYGNSHLTSNMQANRWYINSTRGTIYILKKNAPSKRHNIPPFQVSFVIQVCTSRRQNQFWFKTRHSPLISKHTQTLCTYKIYLLASCQVTVTMGDSGLCCCGCLCLVCRLYIGILGLALFQIVTC